MVRKISEERKTAFYVGSGMMVVGGLLFLSVFVSGIANFGDFSNFESQAKSGGFRAIGGMLLLMVGQLVRTIGARGLAGSGVLLDPERAKEELEPYSRMAGGMAEDFLEEADISLGKKPEKVIMIKCQSCNTLNEDDSKFCQECGKEI